MMLFFEGMKEEGFFCLVVGVLVLKCFKQMMVLDFYSLEEFCFDLYVVVGVFKFYLWELLEFLMIFDFYDDWMRVVSLKELGVWLQVF